ncbi:MAG: hypothetical protein ABIK73_06050 [candidate division WOR-3 bacterium]
MKKRILIRDEQCVYQYAYDIDIIDFIDDQTSMRLVCHNKRFDKIIQLFYDRSIDTLMIQIEKDKEYLNDAYCNVYIKGKTEMIFEVVCKESKTSLHLHNLIRDVPLWVEQSVEENVQ